MHILVCMHVLPTLVSTLVLRSLFIIHLLIYVLFITYVYLLLLHLTSQFVLLYSSFERTSRHFLQYCKTNYYLHGVSTRDTTYPCRSVLSQGPYTLHMWSHPGLDDEAITYQADKLSTATNPDIADSMAISFLLDRYSFPVVVPNTVTNSECSNSRERETHESHVPPPLPIKRYSLPANSLADNVTLKSPTTAINTKKPCLRRFREESVRYASSLPQYLRNVDWMNRNSVEDVHWLLGYWQPEELDVTVALELLSMDFADEFVRRLAVKRLESLSNDDVLKYLLQLVQVCVYMKIDKQIHSYCVTRKTSSEIIKLLLTTCLVCKVNLSLFHSPFY